MINSLDNGIIQLKQKLFQAYENDEQISPLEILNSLNTEPLLDNAMLYLSTKQEEYVVNEIMKIIIKQDIHIDKNKLLKWLNLCNILDNIDRSNLVDIAIKKKFKQKDSEIANLKSQLDELKNRELI